MEFICFPRQCLPEDQIYVVDLLRFFFFTEIILCMQECNIKKKKKKKET